ncbi:hypothetical protein FGG08_001885 [Glutinoglossum americanum]|uniref:Uncharacterized protein n=1 Tax=Glutinoglossum americanum TaxID=1670608 RepID=A0A9P8L5Z7_9PEZI|nr:hypothetical protein FGG08_001885 [Glutinoglossum americanum]
MDAHKRRSKRSTTSLNHLSLAPLTPKFPIGDEDELPDFSDPRGRSSYIEGKSKPANMERIIEAPTTPRILSRNSSSVRLTRTKQNAIPKSKSSSQLLGNGYQQRKSRKNLNAPSSEWLERAGAIISSETRESKGQSWLVSRASSTSLVDYEGREDLSFADDEFSPYSPRNSRGGSRVGSRVVSRHGSKSKIDLLTPWARAGIIGDGDDMAGDIDDEYVAEPDFVDVDEDIYGEVDADAELSQIAKLRGFGLGSWVDRLIGWSLFAVEEDEESEDDGEAEADEQERKKLDAETRRKREEFERVIIGPPGGSGEGVSQGDQEGGWQDAAWLLSVATKVLF